MLNGQPGHGWFVLVLIASIAGWGITQVIALRHLEQVSSAQMLLEQIDDLSCTLDTLFYTGSAAGIDGRARTSSHEGVRSTLPAQIESVRLHEAATRQIDNDLAQLAGVLNLTAGRDGDPAASLETIGFASARLAGCKRSAHRLLVERQWAAARRQRLAALAAAMVAVLGLGYSLVLIGRDRRREEEYLRGEPAMLASAVRCTEDGVLICRRGAAASDGEPVITFINRAFCRITGMAAHLLKDQPLSALENGLVSQQELSKLEQSMEQSRSFTLQGVANRCGGEPAGEPFHSEWHVSPVAAEDGTITHFVLTLRDVSRLRQEQARLVEAEHLAFIGTLSQGLAHNVNNPLASAQSSLQDLEDTLGIISEHLAHLDRVATLFHQDQVDEALYLLTVTERQAGDNELDDRLGDLDEQVSIIRDGLVRTRTIIDTLNEFSRKSGIRPRLVDVNSQVERALALVAEGLQGKRCAPQTSLGQLPQLRALPGDIVQAVTNLLMNAVQAIPEQGGAIAVATAFEQPDIVITVADNGAGVAPEDQDKVFAPFFTTHDVGGGLGLGLSVAYGIVRRLGGTLSFTSNGDGTTFTVQLPVANTLSPASC